MAAANILSVGASVAVSSDVVVTTTPLVVSLKTTGGSPAPIGALVNIYVKGDDSNYYPFAQLTHQAPSLLISGPGTYSFRRPTLPAAQAVGVFSA